MSNRRFVEYRRRMVPQARGRELEIGIGSGLNPPFCGGQVASIYGIDPSAALTTSWQAIGGPSEIGGGVG